MEVEGGCRKLVEDLRVWIEVWKDIRIKLEEVGREIMKLYIG